MPDPAEANKDVIRLLAEVDRGNVDVVADYHTADDMDHTPSTIRRSITIYRIVDGRIAERWAEHGVGLLEQLGISLPDSVFTRASGVESSR